MNILDRYLGKALLSSTLVVMLVLLSLFFFIEFVDELSDIGEGNYRTLDAVKYLLLIQPQRMYELFPTAALLGSIVGLGWLAANSELLVIRAAGVSLPQITLKVMKTGLLLILAMTFIGEVVAPPAQQYGQNLRSIAKSDRISLRSDYGFWTRNGTTFINIRQILPDRHLGDVYIYEFDSLHRLRLSTYAKKGRFSEAGDGKDGKWILEGIVQSQIAEQGVKSRKVARASWESLLSPDLIDVITLRPEKMSTWALFKYITYLHDNGQDAERYQFAFWNKLLAPLVTAIMIFLSIPFVFGPLRASGMGQRTLVGSLLGIGFYLFNQTFSQVGLVYNFNPILSALVPLVLFLGLSLVLMRRVY